MSIVQQHEAQHCLFLRAKEGQVWQKVNIVNYRLGAIAKFVPSFAPFIQQGNCEKGITEKEKCDQIQGKHDNVSSRSDHKH